MHNSSNIPFNNNNKNKKFNMVKENTSGQIVHSLITGGVDWLDLSGTSPPAGPEQASDRQRSTVRPVVHHGATDVAIEQ